MSMEALRGFLSTAEPWAWSPLLTCWTSTELSLLSPLAWALTFPSPSFGNCLLNGNEAMQGAVALLRVSAFGESIGEVVADNDTAWAMTIIRRKVEKEWNEQWTTKISSLLESDAIVDRSGKWELWIYRVGVKGGEGSWEFERKYESSGHNVTLVSCYMFLFLSHSHSFGNHLRKWLHIMSREGEDLILLCSWVLLYDFRIKPLCSNFRIYSLFSIFLEQMPLAC